MFGALSSTLVSCGDPPKKSTESASKEVVVGAGEDSALFVGISTTWVNTEEAKSFGSCVVSTMVQPETVSTCKLRVPEGQLYYSKLNITIGTKLADLCPVVRFTPYRYQISATDGYLTPDGSELKCATEAGKTAGCWGGAATQMVPDFPKYKGVFQVSAYTPNYTYESASDTVTGWYGSRTNRGVVNNLASADRASTGIAGYIASSMVDYTIVCEDLWAHPIYTIVLTLVDEDTKGSDEHTYDEIQDWD